MVKEILRRREAGEEDVESTRTDLVMTVYRKQKRIKRTRERERDRERGAVYLKVLFLGAEQQRLTAAGDVGHAGHDQEGRMVGEHVVEETEPLVTSQHL